MNTSTTANSLRTLFVPQMVTATGEGVDGILFDAQQMTTASSSTVDLGDLNASTAHWLALPATQKLAKVQNCILKESSTQLLDLEVRKKLDATGIQSIPDKSIADSRISDTEPSPEHLLWDARRWYLKPVTGQLQNKAARRATIRALQLVLEDANPKIIEDAIKRDASLTFNILRLANSAFTGLKEPTSSIADAITIVGRSPLKRWLNLMVFYSNPFDKRREMLLSHAAFRAFSLEQLTLKSGGSTQEGEQAFLAGMASLMGLLFDLPMSSVLDEMGATSDLRQCVLEHKGKVGQLLHGFEQVSSGDRSPIIRALVDNEICAGYWNEVMSEGSIWVHDITHLLRRD